MGMTEPISVVVTYHLLCHRRHGLAKRLPVPPMALGAEVVDLDSASHVSLYSVIMYCKVH